jgi:hypothetical protein
MAEVRERTPSLRLSHLREILPYRNAQDTERMIEGMRLAGLPE